METKSERVALARAAVAAALATPGVLAPNAGPTGLHATWAGDERIPGVQAAAGEAGRYDLDLFLTASLVPLHPLVEAIRGRVERAAGMAGLGERVGAVNVTILDVEATA